MNNDGSGGNYGSGAGNPLARIDPEARARYTSSEPRDPGAVATPHDELESDALRSEAELMRTWATMVRSLAETPPELVAGAAAAIAAHIEETATGLDRQAGMLDREALRRVHRR